MSTHKNSTRLFVTASFSTSKTRSTARWTDLLVSIVDTVLSLFPHPLYSPKRREIHSNNIEGYIPNGIARIYK